MKFCDSISPNYSIVAVKKLLVRKKVYGRQMFLCVLVAIQICRVMISPMLGSLYSNLLVILSGR